MIRSFLRFVKQLTELGCHHIQRVVVARNHHIVADK